ncbi:major facilitator superfamily domain-containing protein [Lasiosphaeria hispida]|uniref:Major facilitator superfamily domain-containing protein n=1 Tax=Lasiosphaeria hispida TaxID=260671 RepID=A0AAJ0HEJ3_9PEZI|nr:major facilitator superfamily domain-containing protein [Lasiosphaeria hispida]
MGERDLEGGPPDPSPQWETISRKEHDAEVASSSSSSSEVDPSPLFLPILAAASTRRPSNATGGTSRPESIWRERSNNGYGVEDLVDEADVGAAVEKEPTAEEKDPYEVGWDAGENDPMNPRGMPHWRKWSIIIITSFGAFIVTNASAAYTATYDQMNAEFGNSRLVATIGLSTFVLGIALGPFWSPLAEFYGRRPIYLASFLAFMIWMIPSAVAQNIQTMLVARFFQGLAGSAFLSVSGGTVGDLFSRDKMQMPMAIFTLAPFIGPSTGPLIGGITNSFAYWRWTHYIILIESGVAIVILFFFVPETYHPVLLARKAAALRAETGDGRWKAPLEKTSRSVARTVGYSLLRPFQLLAYEPMCLILDLYSAILLGLLYLFFGAFPLVFRNNHGFNLWQVGLTFMGLLIAMIVAAASTPFWHRVRDGLAERRRRISGGELKGEPEDQLPMVILAAPLITGGLFWFGFTTYPSIHWIVPIIGSGVFGIGSCRTMLAFTGIFTFLVDAYPRYAASALAGNALVRCSFAAAFPLFGIQMYEGLGYQWATGLLAFLTLVMMPFPYIFFVYGKRIRARSRFAVNS